MEDSRLSMIFEIHQCFSRLQTANPKGWKEDAQPQKSQSCHFDCLIANKNEGE